MASPSADAFSLSEVRSIFRCAASRHQPAISPDLIALIEERIHSNWESRRSQSESSPRHETPNSFPRSALCDASSALILAVSATASMTSIIPLSSVGGECNKSAENSFLAERHRADKSRHQ